MPVIIAVITISVIIYIITLLPKESMTEKTSKDVIQAVKKRADKTFHTQTQNVQKDNNS